MSIAVEQRLEAVIADLRWTWRTEVAPPSLDAAIKTAGLIFSSLRFGRTKLPDVPENPATTALELSDLKAQLVECAHDADDAGEAVCAERIRGAIRLLL